jgi:hypothetical protein
MPAQAGRRSNLYFRTWLDGLVAPGALLSFFLLFSVGRPQPVQTEHPNQPGLGPSYPSVVNELMIGCNQAGAISYLSKNALRVELIYTSVPDAETELAKQYDEAYVLRIVRDGKNKWTSDTICLYFRNGYLAYKCVVPDDRPDPGAVFRREIVSGLQHPPKFPGLMEKVHWGEAKEPSVATIESGTERKVKLPQRCKVRCGIALAGLPPSIVTQKGANVLVLIQNVGPSALHEDLLHVGFPIGPVIMVSADYHESGKSTGFPSYFGFHGTKLYRIPFDKKEDVLRSGAYHLEPGECTYAWFRVPDVKSYAAVQAELHGIWGADKKGKSVNIRVWDTSSAKVEMKKTER